MCMENISGPLSPLFPPASLADLAYMQPLPANTPPEHATEDDFDFVNPADLQLVLDNTPSEYASEDDVTFVNASDDDVTLNDVADDDFDEDSRSAMFADNGSVSSSAFDENLPSGATLRYLRELSVDHMLDDTANDNTTVQEAADEDSGYDIPGASEDSTLADTVDDDVTFVNMTDDDGDDGDDGGDGDDGDGEDGGDGDGADYVDDEVDEDSRSAMFADHGSVSSSVFEEDPPSRINRAWLPEDPDLQPDDSPPDNTDGYDADNDVSMPPDDEYDTPFGRAKFDRALCQILDLLIVDKKISQSDFDRIAANLCPKHWLDLKAWTAALTPQILTSWHISIFPDCRGKPLGGTHICASTEYGPWHLKGTCVRYFYKHGVDCGRHKRRLDEPTPDENVLWCVLVWPGCSGDPLEGPCCKIVPCAKSDMPPTGVRLWGLPGACDEHEAIEDESDEGSSGDSDDGGVDIGFTM